MTLVLFWDIDGVLLTTARAGVYAWEAAAAEVLGHPVDFSTLNTSGLPDVEIGAHILREKGVDPPSADLARIVALYESYLPQCLPRRKGRVLPNVREILARLEKRRDVLSTLLTGNTRAGARAKLEYYELAQYFSGGAFCDGTADRPTIARNALVMVRRTLGEVPEDRIYLIGDTPHDIRCSEVIGARAVAVATGIHSIDELRAHDPWWAVEELPPPDTFLGTLDAG